MVCNTLLIAIALNVRAANEYKRGRGVARGSRFSVSRRNQSISGAQIATGHNSPALGARFDGARRGKNGRSHSSTRRHPSKLLARRAITHDFAPPTAINSRVEINRNNLVVRTQMLNNINQNISEVIRPLLFSGQQHAPTGSQAHRPRAPPGGHSTRSAGPPSDAPGRPRSPQRGGQQEVRLIFGQHDRAAVTCLIRLRMGLFFPRPSGSGARAYRDRFHVYPRRYTPAAPPPSDGRRRSRRARYARSSGAVHSAANPPRSCGDWPSSSPSTSRPDRSSGGGARTVRGPEGYPDRRIVVSG